jgi:hypothetical protein
LFPVDFDQIPAAALFLLVATPHFHPPRLIAVFEGKDSII